MRIRVLIADDQALIRRGMSLMLDLEPDIEVVGQAANGTEAVSLSAQLRPDVVLMDLHMPGMSGYEVTRALRARHSSQALPIVALTAAAFEEDRERCESVGMNDFVTKPIGAERLHAVLVKWRAARRDEGGAAS